MVSASCTGQMPSPLADPALFLRRLLARFGLDCGPARALVDTAAKGLALLLIVALGTGLLFQREWRLERERAAVRAAIEGSSQAERAVSRVIQAQHDYLLGGQPAQLEEFSRRRDELQVTLRDLVPLLGSARVPHDHARTASGSVQLWLDTSAAPQIEAHRTQQDVAMRAARDAGAPILARLNDEFLAMQRELGERYESIRSASHFTSAVVAVGAALLAVLGLGSLVATTRRAVQNFREYIEKNEAAHAQTRAIINTTLDGVITIDQAGLILSMNPAAEKIFAQSEKEMLGKNFSTLIPQRHLLHDMNGMGRGAMMAIGQRQGYFSFPVEISLNEMLVGHRKQFVAVVRDVSERANSVQTLKHIGLGVSGNTGEEFLRSLLKELSKALSQEFAFLVEVAGRGDDAVCTFALASKGAIQRSGQESFANTACAEAMRKGFRLFPSGVRAKFPEDHILEELGAESFVAMPLTDHMQRTVGLIGVIDRKPLEETELVESVLQIIGARAGGEIVRKRFEEDLAAEKERLAVTLRSIGEGFITTNNEGNVVMLNAVAESLIGWSQVQALGKPLFDIFHLLHEKTRKRCTHALSRIVETGTSEDITYPAILVASDGRERLVECSTSPIRDKAARKLGVVIVFRDVTEKMRVAEEEKKAEKLESLGVVAGGIAHDFNNVLTMIVGNVTSVLKMPGIDGRIAEHLHQVTKATARAEELAKQLLPFAKGGAPIRQTVSIAQLVRDTVACTLQGSKTWCESTFPDDLWPVEVDPGQISQVIHHLALNADQAMPAGGNLRVVAENIELSEDDPDLGLRAGRWVRLCLKDEGIGVPHEYQQRIFDPYFTTKPKGAGLGLATTHRILKNHGSTIVVESEPGMGSAFTTYLPASERELSAPAPTATPPAQVPARVLVLDDEEAICMIIQCALEDLGHEVTVTHDGKDAVAAYEDALRENRRFDLVVSDLSIPGGMGGKDTIKRLCEIDPEVRAIVSSGYANDPVMSRYEDFGFTGMIAKPYSIDAMCQKVAEVLSIPRQSKTVSAAL
jgi:PAS domain S-box-containing protein